MSEEIKDNVVVEAVGLTKIFTDFWGHSKAKAVNGISFEIKQGQVFGMLGPNGSGKSTTIKMILGLLYPSRGTLKVFGKSPEDVATKTRIGYLPEETYLYKYLTAMETLEFFGALFGLSASQCKERAKQLLDMVGLSHAQNRPVGEFSKGMARRIGLAQALVNDPDLVILDEPTSGLDPIGCKEVKDLIRLLAARGKTVILCSHLLGDVQDVSDEVLIMYGGEIRKRGKLEEILREEDKTQVTTPKLSDAALAELKQFLKSKGNLTDDEIDVRFPGRDLEGLFLNVVKEAVAQNVATAGAHTRGDIPSYLLGDQQEEAPDQQAMLEALRNQVDPTLQKKEEVAEPEKKVDLDALSKLKDLGDDKPLTPSEAQKKAEEEAAKAAEMAAINDKLKNLKL